MPIEFTDMLRDGGRLYLPDVALEPLAFNE
jgi:hypothetical protein